MIFEKLTLENFRQFYGLQEVQFAEPGPQNVTLIHAENGFGKTAMLNSLAWVLYEELSDDFERPEEIINQRAVSERGEAAQATVTLHFTDASRKYTVSRTLTYGQQVVRERAKPRVIIMEPDGRTRAEARNPEVVIEGVLPKAMWKYFFFNGERIDHLARDRASKEIADAIQRILGLTLLQQTKEDLKNFVCKHFRDQVAEHGDADTRKAKGERDKTEAVLVKLREELEQFKLNETALLKRKEEIEGALRKDQATRQLQVRRDTLNTELQRLGAELRDQKRGISSWISASGGFPFGDGILRVSQDILEKKRRRREIPSRFRTSFIHDVLHDERCICERELTPGTAPYEAVERLIGVSGDDIVEEACANAHNAIGIVKQRFDLENNRLRQLVGDKCRVETRVAEINAELSEIHHQIGTREGQSGTSLEEARHDTELQLREVYSKQGVIEDRIVGLSDYIAKIDAAIERGARRERGAALAQRRLSASEETCRLIDRYLKAQAAEVRAGLSAEIDASFRRMCRKDYWAELDEDYVLRIRKRVRVGSEEVLDVAKSTGENQITSLAFIGSLVKLASERERQQTNFALGGGTFPVVMDSPFGSLDNEYREGIAEWLPVVAPQIVILATGSQWEGVVENALASKVGREYLMVYHGPRAPKDGAKTRIELRGREYTQLRTSTQFEHTQIEEVAS